MLPHEFAIIGAAGAGGGGAPVEFIDDGGFMWTDTPSGAPSLPGGWAAGDHALAIALRSNAGTDGGFGITSGWNSIDNPGAGAPGQNVLGVWERVLQGGDSAPTITHAGSNGFQAVVLTFTLFGSYILDSTENPAAVSGADYQIPGGPESSTDAGSLALAIHGKFATATDTTLKSGSEQGFTIIYTYRRPSGSTNRNNLAVASKAVDVESVTLPTFTIAGNTNANNGLSLILQP
jgi:hypothetical protein